MNEICKEFPSFFVMHLSGMFYSEDLAATTFVEDIDKLFNSLNSVSCAVIGKALQTLLGDNSPHVGYWTRESVRISSWIFLKDAKPTFKQPPPSQTGWLIDIAAAAEDMWRRGRVRIS
jgi:hypothetical protein